MSNADFVDKDLVVLKVPNVVYANKSIAEMVHDFILEKIEDEITLEDEKERVIS